MPLQFYTCSIPLQDNAPHTRLAFKPAQKTPAHLPERLELQITREEGCGLFSAYSTAAPLMITQTDFWRASASCLQNNPTEPQLLHPLPGVQCRSCSARSSAPQLKEESRLHPPAAQTDRPSPPPARASCHVAQGRGARLCGAGPGGRAGTCERLPAAPASQLRD